MGSVHLAYHEPRTPPKLSLLSLPMQSKPFDPPGILTPPLHAAVSVPFQWEEAPGKPRPSITRSNNNNTTTNTARSLNLQMPPKLAKVSDHMDSPTTVLDDPYVARAMSFTTSFRKPRGSDLVKGECGSNSDHFGSTRWWKSNARDITKDPAEGSFDFSYSGAPNGWGHDHGSKVKITRVRRRGSFLSLSQPSSHFLASIYEGLKQVVPWKSRQEKNTKSGILKR